MIGDWLRKWFGGKEEESSSQAMESPVEESSAQAHEDMDIVTPTASESELVAAIAAAIASVWTGPTGFVVRRIRRVPRFR